MNHTIRHDVPVHPASPRSTHRLLPFVLALVALVLSSCTLSAGKHVEVDFLGSRYRFYIYEKPTSQAAVELRSICIRQAGSDLRDWSQCSLKILREQVQVPSIGRNDWRVFTGSDQWRDYGEAVAAVRAGGFAYDRTGQRYARHCLVGDHFGFRDYNWTTRAASDGHCKRGVNV